MWILTMIFFLIILISIVLYRKRNNAMVRNIIVSSFILIVIGLSYYLVLEYRSYDYFDTEFNKYNEVISLIKDNKLKSVDFKDESGNLGKRLYLPSEYKKLSKDGIVIYSNKNGILTVLFVTSSGDRPDGYLYKSDNLPPKIDDFYETTGFDVRKKENWFVNHTYYKARNSY